MQSFTVTTLIRAPIERCFDLARDIGFHQCSFAHTGERVVAGRADGLIELGETVTWEGRHLGVRQRLTSKVVAFERPTHFRDEMQAGAFKSLAHEHRFAQRAGGTVMTDTLSFAAPLGPLGWVAERLFLRRHMTRLIKTHAQNIRIEAENHNPPTHSDPLFQPKP